MCRRAAIRSKAEPTQGEWGEEGERGNGTVTGRWDTDGGGGKRRDASAEFGFNWDPSSDPTSTRHSALCADGSTDPTVTNVHIVDRRNTQ